MADPRHHCSGAPSWRCPEAGPTGPSSASPASSPSPARPSSSASTSSRSTGRCRSTPTSPAAARTPSGCSTSPRPRPRRPATRSRPVLLQARDVGAAIVDEASERGADLLICGLRIRTKFGGDFAIGRDHPLRPEERARARSGSSARRCPRSSSMKAVVVGCGRVGAGVADELDRAGWQVADHRSRRAPSTGCRPAFNGQRHPRQRHRRGRPAPRRHRERRPVPRPDRGRQPQHHGGAARRSRCSTSARASPRSTTRSGPRRTRDLGIATLCRTNLMADAILGYIGLAVPDAPGIYAPEHPHQHDAPVAGAGPAGPTPTGGQRRGRHAPQRGGLTCSCSWSAAARSATT